MNKKSQKDIVFEVIKDVLGDSYTPSESMKPYFGWNTNTNEWNQHWGETKSLMNNAIDKLIEKYKHNELVINKNFDKDTAYRSPLRIYLKNLIFNWLNKDKRLNGGRHYQSFKSSVRYRSYPGDEASQKNNTIIKEVLSDKELANLFEMIIKNKDETEKLKKIKEMLVSRVLEVATENYNSRDFITKKAA